MSIRLASAEEQRKFHRYWGISKRQFGSLLLIAQYPTSDAVFDSVNCRFRPEVDEWCRDNGLPLVVRSVGLGTAKGNSGSPALLIGGFPDESSQFHFKLRWAQERDQS
jgi:hypothetical protein